MNLDYVPPAPATPYGIGIIGAGAIVRNTHLVAYRKASLNIVGITDADSTVAHETARVHNVQRVFDMYY